MEVVYSEKSRVTEECFHGSVSLSPQDLILKGIKRWNLFFIESWKVLIFFDYLKVSFLILFLLLDKLANEVQQILPSTEGFIFKDSDKFLRYEEEAQVQHRDIGTEMTPIGSLTTSRCHTPFKSTSPARHNTPSQLSGPLTETKNVIDISEFADKLRLSGSTASQYCNSVTSHWNSREEEEEEISKSLRHFDMESELRRSVSESKVVLWDDEEGDKIKFCQRYEIKFLMKFGNSRTEFKNWILCRYQREEAKIQAWVNLENAKAEAQSRKLEVCVLVCICKKYGFCFVLTDLWSHTSRLEK